MKMPKSGTKVPYLGIFGLEFYKSIIIIEISTLKFVYLQNLTEKHKYLNLGPKMSDLGVFGQKCLIWVFLAKNALFGYFG